jgi:hypothetical protein
VDRSGFDNHSAVPSSEAGPDLKCKRCFGTGLAEGPIRYRVSHDLISQTFYVVTIKNGHADEEGTGTYRHLTIEAAEAAVVRYLISDQAREATMTGKATQPCKGTRFRSRR